jgi:hypothetical protein
LFQKIKKNPLAKNSGNKEMEFAKRRMSIGGKFLLKFC